MRRKKFSQWLLVSLLIFCSPNLEREKKVTLKEGEEVVLFREEFNGSLGAEWEILNEDAAYYSFDQNYLYLRANGGDLWQARNDYKNLFLIDNPTDKNFDLTVKISEFKPHEGEYPQFDIVAYDDDDNHVRSIYGFINSYTLEFGIETKQIWTSMQHEIDFGDSEFFLRLKKIGKTYIQLYSEDGIDYIQVNSPVLFGDGSPQKLGFAASVDPDESSIAKIDWFEITSVDDLDDYYVNPVYSEDFPDPFIFSDEGEFFGYATNNEEGNIPVLKSIDLNNWKEIGDAFPKLPAWSSPNQFLTWAPSLLKRDDTYILYYTVRYDEIGLQCISRAIGDSPKGPFSDQSVAPFICQSEVGGSIDPSPFVDSDGQAYLLWKNDGNSIGAPIGIWIQRLSNDGLEVIGKPTQLIEKDQEWEEPTIEGPSMLKVEEKYYLFYSANDWASENYAIGYAVCDRVIGPCKKPSTKPFYSSNGTALGPGGQEFVKDQNGDLWMAFHAWNSPVVGYENHGVRSLRMVPIIFSDGQPEIKRD